MARKTDIGPRIGIEGEAEYKRQLAEINEGLKTTKSEMEAVTSAFIGNERSVEALTARSQELEKVSYSLSEKLKLQEDQLQKAAQKFGEADSRTQKYQQAVNKTTADLNRVNAEIAENSSALATQGGMLGKLGIDVTGLASKLGVSSNAAKAMTEAFTGGTAAAAGMAAAAVSLGRELVRLSDQAAANADAIQTLSNNYGLTVQDMQKLKYMENLVDVSAETVAGSMQKLTRSMDSARGGTGQAAEAFSRLGVAVTNSDGSLRSANQVWMEIIDALGRVQNATERDALAMDVFGRNASELGGVIAQGSDGLQKLANEAEQAGYVMSDKMISVLTAGDDATQRLNNAMEALGNTIGAGVTPIVAGWKILLAEAAEGMASFIQKLAGVSAGADEVAESVNGAADAVAGFRDLTAEDFLSDSQKSYKSYVDRALQYQRETGQQVTIYRPDVLSGGYGAVRQSIDVTLKLDGQTLARAATPALDSYSAMRGAVR